MFNIVLVRGMDLRDGLSDRKFLIDGHTGHYELCSCWFIARRAYCVGEVPENHVCPSVRVSVRPFVSVSGPFWIQFLSSKVKIPMLFISKRGPKKDPSGTFGSKSEMDLGQRVIQILCRFRTSSDSDEAHHQFWWAFPSGDLAPQVSSSRENSTVNPQINRWKARPRNHQDQSVTRYHQ